MWVWAAIVRVVDGDQRISKAQIDGETRSRGEGGEGEVGKGTRAVNLAPASEKHNLKCGADRK